MGNSQQKLQREDERQEMRRRRSFDPNSNRKKRAQSLLQSQNSQFDQVPQSKMTANFGLSPNNIVYSQNIAGLPQLPTFTDNKVVSQSVSPINKLQLSNNQPYTPNSLGQDNMLGLTPRTFQRANDLQKSNIQTYYNNLNASTIQNQNNLNASAMHQAGNLNTSAMQQVNKSRINSNVQGIGQSQVHAGANTLVLNKYYNGKQGKNRSNVVLNKYFDGEMIDQNTLNNISSNVLNRTHAKIENTSQDTTLKDTSMRKQRPLMSERLLHRRNSDNSVATFQQQLETFTRRSIRTRMRHEKKYHDQQDLLAAIEFGADYKLISNLFQGNSQSLAQPSLLLFNQELLEPLDSKDMQQRKNSFPSQQQQELQVYLQFVNDTENNAISSIDFINLAKEKKEDEEFKLIDYLRNQQKISESDKVKPKMGRKLGIQEVTKKIEQNQKMQKYLNSSNELPNREFAEMIEQQYRQESLKKVEKINDNNTINLPQSSKSMTNFKQDNNSASQNQQTQDNAFLKPSTSMQGLSANSKNLHHLQMQLFQQSSKNMKETMNRQMNNEEAQSQKQYQIKVQEVPTQQYNPKQVVETLGKEEEHEGQMTEEEWNKLVDPANGNQNNKNAQNKQHSYLHEEKKQEDSDDDDDQYVQVDFDNRQQNNPFQKNVINNQNGFSNMSSIIMNTSQSEIQQTQQQNNQAQTGKTDSKAPSAVHSKQQNSVSSYKQQSQHQQVGNTSMQSSKQREADKKKYSSENQIGTQQTIKQNQSYQSQNQIAGMHQVENNNSIEQFHELNSQGSHQALNSKSHTQYSHQSHQNPAMKESQISVVSEEEKMIHFQNKLNQQQQQSQTSFNHQNPNQNQKQRQSLVPPPVQTSHYLPNFQFNNMPPHTKGTIVNTVNGNSNQQNNSSNYLGIGNQINSKRQSQQIDHDRFESNQKGGYSNKPSNHNKLSPGNDYNSEANESLYIDVHKLEDEDRIRRLALQKAEEEYDEEIRRREIEMMLLDKRIEQKKESNFQTHRTKQFRMEELANKYYTQLKKEQEFDYRANINSHSNLNKKQQDGFIKRYQNQSNNTSTLTPHLKGGNNTSTLNSIGGGYGNVSSNTISGQYSSPQSKQKKNTSQTSNDKNDKYKSSYMNSHHYTDQHKMKRHLQVDSYKQTLYQRQNPDQGSSKKDTPQKQQQDSIYNSNFYKDNEQKLVNTIMSQNIFKKEDQENRQKNLEEYYKSKQMVLQQKKEEEKQQKLLQQQQLQLQQQKKLEEQQLQMKRLQSEESQQHNFHGDGINNLDLFQDFDEAESQHQDEENEHQGHFGEEEDHDDHHQHQQYQHKGHYNKFQQNQTLSENEDEEEENTENSQDSFENEQKHEPIQVKMDLQYFKKNRRHQSDSSDNEDHNDDKSDDQSHHQAEAIPIQIDIKEFMRKKNENNQISNNNNLDNNFNKNQSNHSQMNQQNKQQNFTQNLVQDVKENLKKVNTTQNSKSQQSLKQPEINRKGSDHSPLSARGSIPGFGDRQNSESEGETMLKSITQQVMKLKGKIERDKKDLDQSNNEYQSKIVSKVLNTLNNSKDGNSQNNLDELPHSGNLLPSSSHKILTQVSSQRNIPLSNQDLSPNEQHNSIKQAHSKSSSVLSQNQQKQNQYSHSSNLYDQQRQQQQPQYPPQQTNQNPPILININPASSSVTSSRSHQQANINESKISQRNQQYQIGNNNNNINNNLNTNTNMNNYNNNNNNLAINTYSNHNLSNNHTPTSNQSNLKGFNQDNKLMNQNNSPYSQQGNTLLPPFQINKAVSEYDYESYSQFSSIPNDERFNQQSLIKTLYVDQKQSAPSPNEQQIGYDAAMAKQQNQLLPITSQFEQSENDSQNRRQSQTSAVASHQQINDRKQSINSQKSHQTVLSNMTGKGDQQINQQTPRSAVVNQQASKISSQTSLHKNFRQEQQQSNSYISNQYTNDQNFQEENEQDKYFENQPAQFHQYSSPLIDQSILRRPSNNKPRSSKFASQINSNNESQNFFFEVPGETFGNDGNLNQFQMNEQNDPQSRKQSSGGFSYQSNSLVAANSKKSSIQQNMQVGINSSQRNSNAGLDFFNFPSQGQTTSHQQIGNAPSSKSSVAGYDRKHSIQSQQGQNKQTFGFFENSTNNNLPSERNSNMFDGQQNFNKYNQNPNSHRSSNANTFFNQNQKQQQDELHQYESHNYVNQNDSGDDPYAAINGGDEENGGFNFDAFGEAEENSSEQHPHQNNDESATNIKIDLNNYKRK